MPKLWMQAVMSVLVLGFTSGALHAEDHEKEAAETKMTIEQVPAAPRATLEREAAHGKIQGIEKEVEAGKTIYEADLLIGGKKTEVKVAEDGSLISSKLDGDEVDEDDDDEHGATGKDKDDDDKK